MVYTVDNVYTVDMWTWGLGGQGARGGQGSRAEGAEEAEGAEVAEVAEEGKVAEGADRTDVATLYCDMVRTLWESGISGYWVSSGIEKMSASGGVSGTYWALPLPSSSSSPLSIPPPLLLS